MKPASKKIAAIVKLLQQGDTLPVEQLRKLGLIYSAYRLLVSAFFLLMVYVSATADASQLLPSLVQQTALAFYLLISLILFGLFYVTTKQQRQQLALGLVLDVVILSLLLYTNGAPDLQLTMLYMVVVAASFMLLRGPQALAITLLAIIFVIYQQFFYAIANSLSFTNLGDALLMSASFLAVGFLSWSISQRLVQVENFAIRQADEVERLNAINQEVISHMLNGVMVIDQQHIVLANHATYHLLGMTEVQEPTSEITPANTDRYSHERNSLKQRQRKFKNHHNPLTDFQQQLALHHGQLLRSCLSVDTEQTHSFIYELPKEADVSLVGKLRVQIIPLKDRSQLVLFEDLRREQANAQQLKLAYLGQLTASIAHEIRNPLAAISQASQLLMEDIFDSSNATDSDYFSTDKKDEGQLQVGTEVDTTGNYELYQMIFEQTKRVNRIIEDVLKLSRQQPPSKEDITLATWIPQLLENHFRGHDVFLHTYKNPVIEFDTHQLEQILINLINNGLFYSSRSQPHAYVEVEIYCIHGDVIIDILDDGKGVAANDIEHLFDPFFTTDKNGTGLGLYLSQAFSEANHARLLYVDQHEKTCFRLIIPAVSCSDT